MTDTALASALDEALDHIDDEATPAPATADRPYIAAITADRLFIDPAYQRPLDVVRADRMADTFDPTLLGVLEVAERPDGRYAVIDGGHRLAASRIAVGENAPLVCNVHRGLTPTDEARLFYEIDTKRRALTGWDRWYARRGAGDPVVLDIEKTAARFGLTVHDKPIERALRCTRACETIVDLGGLQLLYTTLNVITSAWGRTVDALTSALVRATANVVYNYPDIDVTRLVTAMQGIAPRQVESRAGALREVHRGSADRLCAAVIVDRYNHLTAGKKVPPFLEHVRPQSKSKVDAEGRRRAAIRAWALEQGLVEPNAHGTVHVTKRLRDAYDAAQPHTHRDGR